MFHTMNLPNPSILEGCSFNPLPYHMVGDKIFPLKTWLMRPYPAKLTEEQKIFNYRVIKNAFRIIVTRWRIFHTAINASVENSQSYIQAGSCSFTYLPVTGRKFIILSEGFCGRRRWYYQIRRMESPCWWHSNAHQTFEISMDQAVLK